MRVVIADVMYCYDLSAAPSLYRDRTIFTIPLTIFEPHSGAAGGVARGAYRGGVDQLQGGSGESVARQLRHHFPVFQGARSWWEVCFLRDLPSFRLHGEI